MPGLTALVAACGIAGQPELLEAIVRVESGGDPLALAVNGAVELVRAPRDRAEAVAMARWLGMHGYSFDAGLAQVNSANHARLGLDAESVFEPCANLRAAAAVLEECTARARASGLAGARAVAAALSCYNTGDLGRGIRNGYAAAVLAALTRRARESSTGTGRADPSPRPAILEAARQGDAFAVASQRRAQRAPHGGRSFNPHHPTRSPR